MNAFEKLHCAQLKLKLIQSILQNFKKLSFIIHTCSWDHKVFVLLKSECVKVNVGNEKESPSMWGIIEFPLALVSIKQHGDRAQRLAWPDNVFFPSLEQTLTAAPHWLACNLLTWADTQSLRQFSPHLSPWQLPLTPFHPKLPKTVISAHSLIHVWNDVRIVDYCSKISWTQGLIDTPTSWGPSF